MTEPEKNQKNEPVLRQRIRAALITFSFILLPVTVPDIARFTMVAGLLKFLFGALAFIIIFGALAGWVVSRIKGHSGRSPAL